MDGMKGGWDESRMGPWDGDWMKTGICSVDRMIVVVSTSCPFDVSPGIRCRTKSEGLQWSTR